VVGFKVHRGALAACARPAPRDPIELAQAVRAADPAPRVVVMEGVLDADNVGGIFRAAMAFGARAVFACGRSCDPLYRKAIRTSMGGSLCVPFARARGAGGDPIRLLAALRAQGFSVVALDPGPAGEPVDALRAAAGRAAPGPVALVVGTEGAGLTAAALAAADRRVRIPMEPGVDSINVATATAIALHVLRGSVETGDGGAIDAAGGNGGNGGGIRG